jgi:hypothetical protein
MSLDALPLTAVFVITVLLVLLSIECGYRAGAYKRARSREEHEAPVGGMVGAVLALLAFLLAFTFGMAANLFQNKRQAVVDEANAVGTTFLRAGMLEEPYRARVRDHLREYVDVRLNAANTGRVAEAIVRSEQLHGLLWQDAEAVAAQHPDSIIVGLFVQALNDMIDMHSTRVQIAVRSRIPRTIWFSLYVVSILGLSAMGYQSGLSGSSRSIAIALVALAFSTVIWLIADLDRSQDGLLRVGQGAMVDLQKSMAALP